MDTKKLRQKILDLAIRGKLVPQDPNDEPASVLLERIREEKERLIKEGKIKRDKKKEISTSDTSHYENLPFEVPESWVWVNGFECFNPMENKKPTGKTFRYIDINSIDNKKHTIAEAKELAVSDAPSRANRGVDTGDTLFSMVRPYLENIAYVNENYANCIASTGFFICKPTQILYPKYLYYLMLSSYAIDGLNTFMKGDNSPSINNDNVTSFLYPIPPLQEQSRIVSFIESVFALIDQIEENKLSLSQFIKQAKSKVLNLAIHGKLVPQNQNDEPASALLEKIKIQKTPATILHYPFEVPAGWKWCKLGDVCKQITDGTHCTPSYVEKGICFLRVTDITESNSSKKFISKEEHNELIKRCKPEKGDVLLSKNGTIGVAKVVDWDYDFSIFVSLCLLKPRSIILNSKYLAFYLRSNEAIKQMKSRGKSFTITNLHLEEIKQLQIIVPPLAEQQRIVSKIEQIFIRLEQIENAMYE